MKPPSNFARVLIVLAMLGAVWFVGWAWTEGAPSLWARLEPKLSAESIDATARGGCRTAWEGVKGFVPRVWRKCVAWFRSDALPFVRDEVVPFSQRVAEETRQGWREGDGPSMDAAKRNAREVINDDRGAAR